MMEEPSVLDYVKEKLTFWKKSRITVPPAPELSEDELPGSKIRPDKSAENTLLALLVLPIPLLLAVSGQVLAELEIRSSILVISFYLLAFICLVVLVLTKMWHVDSLKSVSYTHLRAHET